MQQLVAMCRKVSLAYAAVWLCLARIELCSSWVANTSVTTPPLSVGGTVSGRQFRLLASRQDNHEGTKKVISGGTQSRRAWFQSLAQQAALGTTAVASLLSSSPALALPAIVSSTAVCDATVTVWQRDNKRLLYLLGTAHISELSAELAENLVKDTHPNAVFVELDLKRVGRLPASAVSSPKSLSEASQSGEIVRTTTQTRVVIPAMLSSSQSTASASEFAMATSQSATEASTGGESLLAVPPPPLAPVNKPNWFQRKAMEIATQTVGNALKGMYSNLGEAGFKPGEEFAAAIRAGQQEGAAIVLGDRDVEVTLQRLTQALAVTDLNKLLNPDAEFEKSLAELVPGGVGGMAPMLSDYDNPADFKKELAAYVEKLKDRDNIRKVFKQLQEVAPELVQVMLTERDAYMATGIDTLNDFECMVAVMGLAHQDGVEKNLQQRGWKRVRPACRGVI